MTRLGESLRLVGILLADQENGTVECGNEADDGTEAHKEGKGAQQVVNPPANQSEQRGGRYNGQADREGILSGRLETLQQL